MDYTTVDKIVGTLVGTGNIINAERVLVAARECGLSEDQCNDISKTYKLALRWFDGARARLE